MSDNDRWHLSACMAGGFLLAFSGAAAAGDVTFDRLLQAPSEPGNWLTHHGDYSAKRFSTLNQITTDTVGDMKVAWTYALGGIEGGGIWPHGGLEGTPIVEDGMMYITDGWGSV
ncbi:MAG: PQQ-dependent dehydrogenase, methanol/ethanol family, partial [Geminicoccaceae bacterium]